MGLERLVTILVVIATFLIIFVSIGYSSFHDGEESLLNAPSINIQDCEENYTEYYTTKCSWWGKIVTPVVCSETVIREDVLNQSSPEERGCFLGKKLAVTTPFSDFANELDKEGIKIGDAEHTIEYQIFFYFTLLYGILVLVAGILYIRGFI